MTVDLTEIIIAYIKTSEGSRASAIRALLVNGANSVFEAGEITARILDTAEETRRAAEVAKCLALIIQDAGEEASDMPGIFTQYCVLRAYDRFCGYTNIRALRESIVSAFAPDDDISVTIGQGRANRNVRFIGRTGFRYDETYNVHYEAITVTATFMRSDYMEG